MARLVHRDFSMQVANFGDVVNTRKPSSFLMKRKTDEDSVANQDAVVTNVPVPLNQHVYVTFTIKDGEASKSFQELVDIYLKPAAQTIANSVDRILLGQVHQYIGNSVGNLRGMDSTNGKAYLLAARQLMNENKAYPNGRSLVLSPESETALLNTDLFVKANERGDDGTALSEARLGRVLGWDTYMDQNVPGVTLASTENSGETAGETQEAEPVNETTINVAIVGHAVTVGEYIWIEDEGRVHYATAATTVGGNTTEVVLDSGLANAVGANKAVVAFAVCESNANYSAGYSKGVSLQTIGGGAWAGNRPQQGQILAFGLGAGRHLYTIVEAYVDPDSANRTIVWLDRPLDTGVTALDNAFPGPAGSFNFGFHRNALALVSRPLALPNTALGVRSSVGAYNDIAMRVTMQYNITSQGTIVTLDLLCGVAVLDEDLGVVLLG